jgi:hypothetical protein
MYGQRYVHIGHPVLSEKAYRHLGDYDVLRTSLGWRKKKLFKKLLDKSL